jgi:hypothetical protein
MPSWPHASACCRRALHKPRRFTTRLRANRRRDTVLPTPALSTTASRIRQHVACHGANGEGSGPVPALRSEVIRHASDGELFWYITKGDVNNGMPSWAALPEEKRWHVISYLRSMKDLAAAPAPTPAAPSTTAPVTAPEPTPPFTDFRYEVPGKLRRSPSPTPNHTPHHRQAITHASRAPDTLPKAPPGSRSCTASGISGPDCRRRT